MRRKCTKSAPLRFEPLEAKRLLASDFDLSVSVVGSRPLPSHQNDFADDEVRIVVQVTNPARVFAGDIRLIVDGNIEENCAHTSWRETEWSAQATSVAPSEEYRGDGDNIDVVFWMNRQSNRTFYIEARCPGVTETLNVTATVSTRPGKDIDLSNNVDAILLDVSPRLPIPIPDWQNGPSRCGPSTAVNDVLIFTGDALNCQWSVGDLWRTDGTRDGTTRFARLVQSHPSGILSGIRSGFVPFQDALYFVGHDDSTGRELWLTDGFTVGVVKDIVDRVGQVEVGSFYEHEAAIGSGVHSLAATSQFLMFAANDEISGFELWRSDGTAEGTQLVRDIHPGSEDSLLRNSHYRQHHLVYEDIYYFTADDGVHGRELWRSDGTADGTYMLKEIVPGGEGVAMFLPNDERFRVHEGVLYFDAGENASGTVLWQTDGTAEGTIPAGEVEFTQEPRQYRVGDYWVSLEDSALIRTDLDGSNRLEITNWPWNFTSPMVLGQQMILTVQDDDAIPEGSHWFNFDVRVDEVAVSVNQDESVLTIAAEPVAERENLSFDWDLDGDGIYDDATGRRLELDADEQTEFGLTDAGIHRIAVRMNDLFNPPFEQFAEVEGPDLPLGDINRDGEVDFSDFLVLSTNFGASEASPQQGDLNGDGRVSFIDFLMLSQAFPPPSE